MLELRLSDHRQRHSVLGDIDVTIAAGDRICLLGPSGVGKTTLLNTLAGLDPRLSKGAIASRDDLRVGYLFQEHRLLPWRTVQQNLALVGATPEAVTRSMVDVGLSGYEQYLPNQLSTGMARRAALARCLAISPDLLLLDEPFASLDPDRAHELRSLILALLDAHPAMAMICVTHDPKDADYLANRLWYLAGRPAQLQWDGTLRSDASAESITGRLRQEARTETV
ncbi:ABC transporter ATP-binding protein [Marinobacter caseinilyticus]|uniref:ABC transporter ATP-binding protein n=1 Tax=Marinobacter caseinilyticus TaxID=2692195 RepID=UPI00140735C9|nr:ATP-binding cassette domain-containing protein [Marinobacter caseinilyticus]